MIDIRPITQVSTFQPSRVMATAVNDHDGEFSHYEAWEDMYFARGILEDQGFRSSLFYYAVTRTPEGRYIPLHFLFSGQRPVASEPWAAAAREVFQDELGTTIPMLD